MFHKQPGPTVLGNTNCFYRITNKAFQPKDKGNISSQKNTMPMPTTLIFLISVAKKEQDNRRRTSKYAVFIEIVHPLVVAS